MNPSPLNSWVSWRINAWFPWKTLSFPMRKMLSLPLCRRRSGNSFGAPFWCQSQPRGHPWHGNDYVAVSSMDTKPQMFSLHARLSCCDFGLRLQAGPRVPTKAEWNVNNIPLSHRCAGNNAPEGTGLMNQSCISLKTKKSESEDSRGRNVQFLLKEKRIWALILWEMSLVLVS